MSTVLLLSTPWAYYSMPSIQLGVLKSHLVENGVSVHADHFFLRVAAWMGFEAYKKIWSPNLEDGEAIYGSLLFPDVRRATTSAKWLQRKAIVVQIDGRSVPVETDEFFDEFERFHEGYLDRFDWSSVSLVGFTLNFAQTLSSIYLARKIKDRAPHVRVVLGGAEATGKLGQSLLRHFGWIDYVCSGEGETPLLELARSITSGEERDVSWRPPAGLMSRRSLAVVDFNQLSGLERVPTPVYDDYFDAINELGMHPAQVCECLPFETSRGCYYKCNFCALNLQWSGYRQVVPERAAASVAQLRSRHRMLDFFFVDNITPTNVEEFSERLSQHGVDYRFFYEARANLPLETWDQLARAGLKKVQIGIEALSNDLLRIYNKKATVIHNLQALKNCFRLGVVVTANLIIGHPHTTIDHVNETLANVRLARSFPPIDSISPYTLFEGSPDMAMLPSGVSVSGNHALYRRAYPAELVEQLDLPRKEFAVDRDFEGVDYGVLRETLRDWKEHYDGLRSQFGGDVRPLAMYDGQEFVRIDDRRYPSKRVFFLNETERAIYLALDQPTHIHRLPEATGLGMERIAQALSEFEAEGLIYSHKGRAVALALPPRGRDSGVHRTR